MTLAVEPQLPRSPTPPTRRCDLCSVTEGKGIRVIRFSLVARVFVPGKPRSSRGVGTILLCDRCWRNTGGRRRRQYGALPPAEP